MSFDLLVNGVGDAFSTRHWGTNFLCRKGDFVLAVDCPDLYRRALAENGFEHGSGTLDAEHIDALFLTHLHGDHVNGLEMVLAYRKFVKGGPLTIYTTPEVADVLWERRLQVSIGVLYDGEFYNEMHAENFFDLRVVSWGLDEKIGPFTVNTRQTIHHIPTAGLRISDGDATLGYSCDTAWDPVHFAWLQSADLIVHETSYGPAHTPLFELTAQPPAVRDKLLVVHYPDDLADGDYNVELAQEGQIYPVRSNA